MQTWPGICCIALKESVHTIPRDGELLRRLWPAIQRMTMMRSRPPSFTLTTELRGSSTLPDSSYQRRSLRTARHRMELIALLMMLLAGLLAGWSVHQSHAWQVRSGTAPGETGQRLANAQDGDHEWMQAQRWPTRANDEGERPHGSGAQSEGHGAERSLAAPAGTESGGAHEVLPPTRRDIGRPLLHRTTHSGDTSSDYLLAAGIFVLALLCCIGSLRRSAATTQMTALLAAELFTLIGVGFLSALPAAL
jgi:hypothetical protein